jgi:hypothetical protein
MRAQALTHWCVRVCVLLVSESLCKGNSSRLGRGGHHVGNVPGCIKASRQVFWMSDPEKPSVRWASLWNSCSVRCTPSSLEWTAESQPRATVSGDDAKGPPGLPWWQ